MEKYKYSQSGYKELSLNTHLLLPGFIQDVDRYIQTTPDKIRRRIAINLSGLNGLSTVIISPNELDRFSENDLIKISNLSNRSNEAIGLPHTNDLIIRTASTSFFCPGQRSFTNLSEPALLVRNISGDRKYRPLNNTHQELHSLSEFVKRLPRNSFLMIHDDNYELQTSGIHGTIYEKDGGSEMFLRTGSLQARDMGDSSLGYPTIRINADHIEDLFKVSPLQASESVTSGNEVGSSRCLIKSINCSYQQANDLVRYTQIDKELILHTNYIVKNLFQHEGYSIEFRIYRNIKGWVGKRLHVLDLN